MAPNYYSIEKAAEVLGVTVDEVKELRERRELYGYRDGATWKFKADDVERLAAERASGGGSDDEGDVLLSDHELGQSPGSSGTVIGMDADLAAMSDIKLSVSEGKGVLTGDSGRLHGDHETSELNADDLQLDEAEPLGMPSGKASKPAAKGKASKPAAKGKAKPDSDIGLGEDEDLVLGGSSGGGSDVAIGADSGISLVDPADSGLSLEEPLELGGGPEESLELEEDDMVESPGAPSGSGKRGSSAGSGLRRGGSGPSLGGGDDDFLLTPMADSGDDEDSESGSQVIALDTEGSGEEGGGVPMVPMLDEELGGGLAGAGSMGVASMAPSAMPGAAVDALAMPAAAALPEAPWGGLSIAMLALCLMILIVGGILAYDLTRNIGQYSGPGSISSVLMDTVVGMFEGK